MCWDGETLSSSISQAPGAVWFRKGASKEFWKAAAEFVILDQLPPKWMTAYSAVISNPNYQWYEVTFMQAIPSRPEYSSLWSLQVFDRKQTILHTIVVWKLWPKMVQNSCVSQKACEVSRTLIVHKLVRLILSVNESEYPCSIWPYFWYLCTRINIRYVHVLAHAVNFDCSHPLFVGYCI